MKKVNHKICKDRNALYTEYYNKNIITKSNIGPSVLNKFFEKHENFKCTNNIHYYM